jgi:hypothetical protein
MLRKAPRQLDVPDTAALKLRGAKRRDSFNTSLACRQLASLQGLEPGDFFSLLRPQGVPKVPVR